MNHRHGNVSFSIQAGSVMYAPNTGSSASSGASLSSRRRGHERSGRRSMIAESRRRHAFVADSLARRGTSPPSLFPTQCHMTIPNSPFMPRTKQMTQLRSLFNPPPHPSQSPTHSPPSCPPTSPAPPPFLLPRPRLALVRRRFKQAWTRVWMLI